MIRQRALGIVLLGGLAAVLPRGGPARADGPATPTAQATTVDPAAAIIQALQVNPATAPYRFAVRPVGRQFSLSGRVGTKSAHDDAIRTVIALGYPVRDDLTIDTAEAYRVAALAGPRMRPPVYVYPPPILGRLDDPFYGFEPPLVTYPPFARAVAAREPINLAALAPAAAGDAIPPDAIQMTLDERGVATLRGRVPTLADRVAVGQKVARVPGIAEVVNLLEVGGPAPAAVATRDGETPPPPPSPARPAASRAPAPPQPGIDANAPRAADRAPLAVDGDPLARRVADGIGRRPALAAAAIKVAAREGVVTLSGSTPSAYEAMLAFRAAQQTPGVREVVDRIEFPLPDVDRPNPLRTRGRPEDVEPYLLAQVRRQLGDVAHVEQVRLRGDSLEIQGTIARADDAARVAATLRSIPLLRGFRLEPNFVAD